MSDPITVLLDAAANPKLTVYPLGCDIASNNAVYDLGLAARNNLRALAEEWLRYSPDHEPTCHVYTLPVSKGGNFCTCGWSARRQQIEAFLEATEP
jgi:hypothetical protein